MKLHTDTVIDLKPEYDQIRRLMTRLQNELWEMENQGQIDEGNVSDILSDLASAHAKCRKAKWASVQHLRA